MLLTIADLNIEVAASQSTSAEEKEELLAGTNGVYREYLAANQQAEADIVVRKDICELGEQLPLFDRMIIHGVSLAVKNAEEKNESGFLFTAHSGVGKSTHAFLWQKLLGEERVSIINGDKPIVEREKQTASFRVWGSPWCGKEGLHKNTNAPLRGILLLHRLYTDDDDPTIRKKPYVKPATIEEYFDFMTDQTFLPQNPMALKRTLEMLEQLYRTVPVYHLYADMSRECIELSVRTMGVHLIK